MLIKQKGRFTLVAFGDSFVEGLIKLPIENSKKERDKINFVTKLGKMDNDFRNIENYGCRGASNERIAYRVYKRLKQSTTNCFFLICWSHHLRVSYYDINNDEYEMNIKHSEIPPKNIEFATNMLIFGVHSLLSSLKVPHAQINAFSPMIGGISARYYHKANYINAKFDRNTLFDIIAERYLKRESLDNSDWKNHNQFNVKPNKYIAKCFHPTDEGHTLIAETLNPLLKEYL